MFLSSGGKPAAFLRPFHFGALGAVVSSSLVGQLFFFLCVFVPCCSLSDCFYMSSILCLFLIRAECIPGEEKTRAPGGEGALFRARNSRSGVSALSADVREEVGPSVEWGVPEVVLLVVVLCGLLVVVLCVVFCSLFRRLYLTLFEGMSFNLFQPDVGASSLGVQLVVCVIWSSRFLG